LISFLLQKKMVTEKCLKKGLISRLGVFYNLVVGVGCSDISKVHHGSLVGCILCVMYLDGGLIRLS
jgi:hypothetical protein